MLFGDLLAPTHLIAILLVVLVVFGPKRLPDVGRSLGQGLREFKESISDRSDRDHAAEDDAPAAPTRTT